MQADCAARAGDNDWLIDRSGRWDWHHCRGGGRCARRGVASDIVAVAIDGERIGIDRDRRDLVLIDDRVRRCLPGGGARVSRGAGGRRSAWARAGYQLAPTWEIGLLSSPGDSGEAAALSSNPTSFVVSAASAPSTRSDAGLLRSSLSADTSASAALAGVMSALTIGSLATDLALRIMIKPVPPATRPIAAKAPPMRRPSHGRRRSALSEDVRCL